MVGKWSDIYFHLQAEMDNALLAHKSGIACDSCPAPDGYRKEIIYILFLAASLLSASRAPNCCGHPLKPLRVSEHYRIEGRMGF